MVQHRDGKDSFIVVILSAGGLARCSCTGDIRGHDSVTSTLSANAIASWYIFACNLSTLDQASLIAGFTASTSLCARTTSTYRP